MSTANPEVYGQPNDYIVTPRLLYRDNATLLSQTGAFTFPKSPNFGGTENDYRGELRRGIEQGKVSLNESIDLSICGIGQDKAVSAYGNWQIWRIDRNGDNPKPVRDKYFSLENNVNTFFYAGWYSNGAVERFHTLWSRTNYNDGRFMCWSPNAEQTLNSATVNTNVFEYPIVTYGSKSIIGTVWVGLFNQERPDLGLNWIKLEQWKSNRTQPIAGIALELATPKDITGSGDNRKITYTPHTETTGYGEFQRVSAALLNTVDGRIDYSMLAPYNDNSTIGETGVYLLSLYNYSNSRVTCPEDTRVYIPCEGLFENDNVWWSWSKYEGGGDNIYIARVIPYSDNNYEIIMKMAACFGIPFVTKTKDLEFNMLTGWSDPDLYFPVIDDNGICHGEYTHGADNLTNPFNDLDNVREKNYNPTKDIDPNTYSNTTSFNTITNNAALTKFYVLDSANVEKLGDDLWTICDGLSAGDFEHFDGKIKDEFLTTNPIDSIISLKRFPFNVPHTFNPNKVAVQLGKSTGTAQGYRTFEILFGVNFKGVDIFPRFGDCFLDYSPYTKYELYIPFCGTVEINAGDILGHKLNCQLLVDLLTGSCIAYIMADQLVIGTAKGSCGVDMQMSGAQTATMNANIFNGILNAQLAETQHITSIGKISLNPFKWYENIEAAETRQLQTQHDITHMVVPLHKMGSASPLLSWVQEFNARLMIYYPEGDVITSTIPPELNAGAVASFGHIKGFATATPGKVSSFQRSGKQCFLSGNIVADSISCTDNERQRIIAAFNSGVYLPSL